jgi:hypothetical protein
MKINAFLLYIIFFASPLLAVPKQVKNNNDAQKKIYQYLNSIKNKQTAINITQAIKVDKTIMQCTGTLLLKEHKLKYHYKCNNPKTEIIIVKKDSALKLFDLINNTTLHLEQENDVISKIFSINSEKEFATIIDEIAVNQGKITVWLKDAAEEGNQADAKIIFKLNSANEIEKIEKIIIGNGTIEITITEISNRTIKDEEFEVKDPRVFDEED